jgi:protein-disulfide isomerase
MLSKLVDQQIDENQQLARKLGLMSTPAFYLGMTYKPSKITYINGAVDTQYLQDAINKLVQQA